MAAMAWIFAKLGGTVVVEGIVLVTTMDVLEELGKGDEKEVVWLMVVVMGWVNDGYTTLGCKGNSAMNGSVDELAVDCGYDEYMILWCRGNSGLMGS